MTHVKRMLLEANIGLTKEQEDAVERLMIVYAMDAIRYTDIQEEVFEKCANQQN